MMRIGVDIEDNKRFVGWKDEKLERVFDASEIEYAKKFEDSELHLTAMWCVKESILKGLKDSRLSYIDIVVSHVGKIPSVNLNLLQNEKLKIELSKRKFSNIEITMSHEKDKSVAVALIY